MKRKISHSTKVAAAFAVIAGAGLSGCANINGGVTMHDNSSNNSSPLCQDLENLEERVNLVHEGMTLSEGLSLMAEQDYASNQSTIDRYLKPMDREGIFDTLYPSSARLQGGNDVLEENRAFMKPLSGKFYECSTSNRKGGLTMKSLQSTTKGYDYTVRMVIKDGKFFDKPVVSGPGYDRHKEDEHYLEMITNGLRKGITITP